MKQRGFTLIELMVGIIIFGLFVLLIVGAGTSMSSNNSTIIVGINGITESRCIEGYKFIITQGNSRQILDEFGKGVRCSQTKE